MLSTSFEYRKLISQNSKVIVKADLTLADGTIKNLSGDDFMMGETSFSDAVSSSGSFDIGAAIIGKLDFTLNNYDGRFDDYDFTDSTIVPYIGVTLSNGNIEWLRKGIYTVEQPATYGNTIGVEALDNMRLLERPYSEVNTEYPASLKTIVQDVCSACGITLANLDFANNSFVVPEKPDKGSLNCLSVIAYAAQASGNWARCDTWGRLRLDWYNTSAFEGEDWLDGDRFDEANPYASGDTADGGSFLNYSGGAEADGGPFGNAPWVHVYAYSQASIVTDDVVVTGLRVTAQDKKRESQDDLAGETSLYGNEGYVLEIPDNPLVQYGKAAEVAEQVGARVVGMRFRPFDVSAIGNPAVEPGDPIIITDGQQRQFRSYITTLTYRVGAYETYACNAETPSRKSASSFSPLTQAVVDLRNSVKREKSARQNAVETLARQLSESSGLFMTTVPQQDGSTVYYMHDKATLAESQIVWKLTANAFGISTDGGETYPYGLDVGGNAILNRIYAIGIDASYVNSGTFTVTDGAITVFSADADSGVVILRDSSGNYWNMHTGELRMAATSSIGDTSAQDILDGFNESITSVDVEYAQNQSSGTAPTSGWSTNAPTWQAGYYIWQRTKTVSAGGTSYSDPVCISGRDGATGTNAATIYLYQRASTAPSKPNSSMTYTFSTGTLSGSLGSWSRGIPDGADTCWVIVASAISNSDTDTINASEWSDPVALSTGGIDGLNQATIYLHQRAKGWKQNGKSLVAPSASAFSVSGTTATIRGTVSGTTLSIASEAPAKPSSTLTYTFATGALAGNIGSWSRGVPDGDDPVWVTLATAISAEATDSIAASEWSDPVKLAEDGYGAEIVAVTYAIGSSGTVAPASGWQSSVPNVGKGFWLWAKTEYSDGTESLTCSYMGTDGEDGNSVAIQSVTKETGVTTVVLTNTDGTTETLTIADGEDGSSGSPGLGGYVHVAWATSADGSQGFSTSVSANKTYIGVYTDHTEADSEDYRDYSWSKIKGETGTGVSAVVEQYYLSNKDNAQTGGSWSTTQPAWQEGKYIWTRSAVTWTDGTTTYTSPVLAKAINGANESAQEANKAVSDLDESLNQQGVFNRLTNDGQTQGIYLENSKVYINGTYIKSGTIDANLIKAGALVVVKNNVEVFSANFETGAVSISGECITIGSDSVTSVVNGLKASYGTCTTSSTQQVKEVTIAGFTKFIGQTVTVKFSYANNTEDYPKLKVKNSDSSVVAEGYMLMNNSYFGTAQYWPAQGVLTFVWDGTYWRVADGATLSQIKVLRDSITLSVTDGSLGNSATIKLEVNGRTAQERTLNLANVRTAFRDDNTAITISAGTVTFNSNTFVVNSTYFSVTSTGVITATSGTIGGFTIGTTSIYNSKMTLDSDGLSLKNDTYNVGDIGTGQDVSDSTKKSLNFHLNGQGAYMTWAARTGTSGTYTRKLTYVNKTFGGYTAGKLYVECAAEFSYRTDFYADQYFHNYTAHNFWIDPNSGGADGGITGTMNFVQVASMNSNGTVARWYTGCKMRFKNGLLIEGTFNS